MEQRHGPSLPSFDLSLGKEGITFRAMVAGERGRLGEWVVGMDGGGLRMDVTPAVGLGRSSLGCEPRHDPRLPLTDPGECLATNAGLGRTRKPVMAGADQLRCSGPSLGASRS